MVRAVLFDLDGLLVDSEPLWYDAECALVESLGGVWAPEHQAALIGGTMHSSCRYIADLTGTSRTPDDLAAELIGIMADRFRAGLPLHAGALELLDALADAGVPAGLVSSSYRVLVNAALDRLGHHRFAVSVAGDEISRGKPDPEPYLTACRRLDVPPADCVVLEDAAMGVASAEAAGCFVVAIPSVAPIEPGPRRVVLGSLTAVTAPWLLSLGGDRAEHIKA